MEIDAKGLAAFLAILRYGSFEKAAQQLCITPSAVSQRLKLIEEKVGQTLVVRGQPLRPTPAGAALLKYGQQLDQLQHVLHQELAPKKQQGWLAISIAVNADTLATWLLQWVAPWSQQHQVLLEIRVDDQEQTHHLLQQGEVLACISARAKPIQGCRCTPLGKVRYHCVASPAFYKQYFAKGVTRKALERAPMVRFNLKDDLQHQYLRQHFNWGVEVELQHTLPSSESFVQGIELGLGYGMVPELQMREQLVAGTLCYLTPDQYVDVPLYWHQWGLATDMTKSLTAVIEAGAREAHQV